ncbi:MAG: hypothetical protein M3Z54_07600 [Gemmatimonadota bacterium]|nr:hypothetical protein [Gemmatimonadota bacterium]
MTANIDAFNEAAGVILARLYESFPTPISLGIEEFAGNENTLEQRLYFDTIKFLEQEGYLRIGRYLTGLHIAGVVLTQRGLALLGERLSALQSTVTFGDRIREITKSGAKELLIPVIKELLIRGTQNYLPGYGA